MYLLHVSCLLSNPVNLYLFFVLFLINYRLWHEGALKYLGESVTGIEIGIWNLHSGLCRDGLEDGSGTSAAVQVSWHDSTAPVQGLSHPNEGADNCDINS